MHLNRLLQKGKGQIAQVIGGLVVGIVMLFVGLFMVDVVANATGLVVENLTPASCWVPQNCTLSQFASVQLALTTTTGTIFSVLGLVIIIVALATAIQSLRGVTEG